MYFYSIERGLYLNHLCLLFSHWYLQTYEYLLFTEIFFTSHFTKLVEIYKLQNHFEITIYVEASQKGISVEEKLNKRNVKVQRNNHIFQQCT